MRLYVTYQTKENRFTSFEVECKTRLQAFYAASDRKDYKKLHKIIRLKNKPVRREYNGCHDDGLKLYRQ